MKRNFILGLAIATLTLGACGDDNIPTKDDPSNNPDIPTVESGSILKPSEQQKKLQAVGQEALGYISALDFTYWRQLADHIDNNYTDNDDYDTDEVENFFDDLVTSTKIGTHTEHEYYGYYQYTYRYTDYRKLILLSNLHAQFNAGATGWTRRTSDDLQFTFTDQNRKECVAKLTTSGKKQIVHVVDIEEWQDYYNYTEEYDNNKYYVEVPERIQITFTVDKKERMKADIKIDLSGVEKEVLDLSKIRFNAEAVVKIDDYEFKTTNIKYTASNTFGTDFEFIKNHKTIFKTHVAASDFDALGINGDIVEEDTWENIEDNAVVTGGNAEITLDVLGQVTIKSKLKDFQKIRNLIEDLDEYEENETKYKKAIDELNSLVQTGVHYDGRTLQQASIKFMAFEERDRWSSDIYWESHPVLCFEDGSSYSLIEENQFFNESAFKTLIDAFNNLYDDFEELIDN